MYVQTVHGIWQPLDLHRTWKSAWGWEEPAPELQVEGRSRRCFYLESSVSRAVAMVALLSTLDLSGCSICTGLYFRIARVGKKESDEDSDKEDEDDDWTFVSEKRST